MSKDEGQGFWAALFGCKPNGCWGEGFPYTGYPLEVPSPRKPSEGDPVAAAAPNRRRLSVEVFLQKLRHVFEFRHVFRVDFHVGHNLVPGRQLPYRKTHGMEIKDVVRLRRLIPFEHPRGAIGIVTYYQQPKQYPGTETEIQTLEPPLALTR